MVSQERREGLRTATLTRRKPGARPKFGFCPRKNTYHVGASLSAHSGPQIYHDLPFELAGHPFNRQQHDHGEDLTTADVDRQSDILSQVPHLDVEETTTPWLADRTLQNTAILQEVVSSHQDNSTGKRKSGSGNDYSPPSIDILLLWKPLCCMLSVVRVMIYTELVGAVEVLA